MAQFKKYGVPVLVVIAALIVNFLICIFLHGYVMAPVKDPFHIEGITEVFEDQANSRILDTYADGDSALTLIQKEDDNVFLLEFHKNLLMNRYQLLDVVHVIPEAQEEHLPVATVFRSYSVLVKDHASLTQETSNPKGFHFVNFFLLYGMNTLLLALMEFIVWKTGRNIKKKRNK